MDKFSAKSAFIIVVLLLVTSWPVARAVEVTGLYQIDIAVADQTAKTRWGAVLEGFKEVLVRKSGSRQVLSTDEVREAYRKVTAYIQRFEYASNTDPEAEKPFILHLEFAPRLVDELIQASGMPIWGSNRPVTILWLANEVNFQREIVRDDPSEGALSELIMKNAQRRGIPVILPLMDLEDELNVTLSDIWGRFTGTIVTASERYAADSVVTGRIQQVGESWQAKLSYINQGDEQFMAFSEPTPELLMATMSDRIAEFLCQKYCVVETDTSHQVKLQVSSVGNFASFKGVQNYLQSLSSIRKVEVDKISATTVRFNVALLGDLQSVKDGIELGNKLIEESAPALDPFVRTISEPNDSLLNENLTPSSLITSDEPLPGQQAGQSSDQQSDQDLIMVDPQQLFNEKGESPIAEPVVTLFYRWVE